MERSNLYGPNNLPQDARAWQVPISQIKARLLSIRRDYQRMCNEYRALPLAVKRDIRLDIAVELYMAAAIFEPLESGIMHISDDIWPTLGVNPPSELTHCPVAIGWFEDMRNLYNIKSQTGFGDYMVQMAHVEWKRLQAERLLNFVRYEEPMKRPAPEEQIKRSWNLLCDLLRGDDHTIESALAVARREFAKRDFGTLCEPAQDPYEPRLLDRLADWWSRPSAPFRSEQESFEWFPASFTQPIWPSAELLPIVPNLQDRILKWQWLTQPPPQYEKVLRAYRPAYHLWSKFYLRSERATSKRVEEELEQLRTEQWQRREQDRENKPSFTGLGDPLEWSFRHRRTEEMENANFAIQQARRAAEAEQELREEEDRAWRAGWRDFPRRESHRHAYDSTRTSRPEFKTGSKPKSNARAKSSSPPPRRDAPPPRPDTPPRRPSTPRPRPRPASAKTTAPKPDRPPVGPQLNSQEAFEAYNRKWASLDAHDKAFPYPSRTGQENDLLDRSSVKYIQEKVSLWSEADVVATNVQVFFLEAFGLQPAITMTAHNRPVVAFVTAGHEAEISKLIKHLKLKEMSRWHPDKLNRRTGIQGSEPDEGISKIEGHKAIWSGIETLLATCKISK